MASYKNNLKDAFKQTAQFDLLRKDDGFFLENKQSSGVIETDETGSKLLEYLPGSIRSVIDAFAAEGFNIPDTVIKSYFLLFREIGIIEKTDGAGEVRKAAGKPTKKTTAKHIKISVIIVTRNSERFILKNLKSIYQQTLLPDEIIVVDNDSTDSTLPSVEKEYPAVKICRNNKNLHYARSVNIGINQAEGDLFIVLNDDIQLECDFIERIVGRYEKAEDKKKIAAIGPVIRWNKFRSCINSVGNMVLKNNWGADNFMGAVDLGQFREISSLGSVCFAAVAIPRHAWETVGEMDHGFKFYDDIDWCFRAHLEGLEIPFVPEAIAYHDFGGTYPSGMKLAFIVKSRLRYVLKNYPRKTGLRFLAGYIWLDIKNTLFMPGERRWSKFFSYAKGYFFLLPEIPGIIWYRLKRKGTTEKQLKEFYEKSPPFTTLLNHKNQPLVTREVIEKYYSHFLGQ